MFDSLQQQQMPLHPPQHENCYNENSASASTQSMKEDLIHFLKDIGSGSTSTSDYSFDSNISSFSFTK